jgi:hypothetical protein
MRIIGKIFLWAISMLAVFFILIQSLIYFNREKIAATINQELQKYIEGEIHIGAVNLNIIHDFPKTTLSIKDVYLRGLKYNIYKKDLLKIEKLFIRVHLLKLIKGEINLTEISLKNAEIFIFKTKDGYTNLSTFKKNEQHNNSPPTSEDGGLLANIESLKIENTNIFFYDSLLGKSFELKLIKTENSLKNENKEILVNLKGKINFSGLMFNSRKGTFLKNTHTVVNLNLAYAPSNKSLKITESTIALKSGTIKLNALFKFENPMWYQLAISSDSIEAKEAIAVLSESIQKKLSRYKVTGIIGTKVWVQGYSISGNSPTVKINFYSNKANAFLTNKYHFKNIYSKGYFTNQWDSTLPADQINSALIIDTLIGNVNDLNVRLRTEIKDFFDASLSLKVNISGNAAALNLYIDSTKAIVKSGTINTNFSYDGKLNEYENNKQNQINGKLFGDFTLTNGALSLTNKNLHVNPINCKVNFNHDQLLINKLVLFIGRDYISITGKIDHFIPFFTEASDKSNIQLNLKANRINLDNFIKTKKQKSNTKIKENKLKSFQESAVAIHEKITYNILVQAEELVKDNFKVTQVKASLKMKNDNLSIGPLEAKFAGGTIIVKGEVKKFSNDWSPIQIHTYINKVDMSEFMYSFNNFGSSKLTSKNISGKMTAKVELSSMLDKNANVMNKFLKGHVNMVVEEGKLINYEPIMELGNFMMINRDFKNVSFSKIEADLKTFGTETEIKRMEISTNVARLFIEGRYSLIDSTNIIIQVPLSNLKKHDKSIKPENIGTDSKMGPSIYLNIITNKGGKMKIAYRPFPKKTRKK